MSDSARFNDDSIPRIVPRPIVAVSEAIAAPIVPEVSLIFDQEESKPRFQNVNENIYQPSLPFKTYSSWRKAQQISSNPISVDSSPIFSPSTLIKKHVRFESSSPALLTTTTTAENKEPLKENPIKNSPICTPLVQSKVIDNNLRYSRNEEQNYETTSKQIQQIFEIIRQQNEQIYAMQQQIERILNEKVEGIKEKVIETKDKMIQCDSKDLDNYGRYYLNEVQQIKNVEKCSIGVMTSFQVLTLEKKEIMNPKKMSDNNNNKCEVACQHDDENIRLTLCEDVNHLFEKNFLQSPHIRGKYYYDYNNNDDDDDNNNKSINLNPSNQMKFQQNLYRSAMKPRQQKTFLPATVPSIVRIPSTSSSDRSLAMNALALKYLPDDKLNDLIISNRKEKFISNNDNNNKTDENTKPITEMSLASYRYMEKYGLIESSNERKFPNGESQEDFNENVKFLNVRKLKKQPKLL